MFYIYLDRAVCVFWTIRFWYVLSLIRPLLDPYIFAIKLRYEKHEI